MWEKGHSFDRSWYFHRQIVLFTRQNVLSSLDLSISCVALEALDLETKLEIFQAISGYIVLRYLIHLDSEFRL